MSDEQKRSIVQLPNGTTINDVVSVTAEMGTFPYRLEPRNNTFYLQADARLTIDGKPLG